MRTYNNKYQEGQLVKALAYPNVKLIIRRYVDRIYYCRVQFDPSAKEQVYFEREIESI